jgi:hypothetical protein
MLLLLFSLWQIALGNVEQAVGTGNGNNDSPSAKLALLQEEISCSVCEAILTIVSYVLAHSLILINFAHT